MAKKTKKQKVKADQKRLISGEFSTVSQVSPSDAKETHAKTGFSYSLATSLPHSVKKTVSHDVRPTYMFVRGDLTRTLLMTLLTIGALFGVYYWLQIIH